MVERHDSRSDNVLHDLICLSVHQCVLKVPDCTNGEVGENAVQRREA